MTKDDGLHAGVTAEPLSRIKPAFAKDGSIHSGNAAAVRVLGVYVTAGIVDVAPLLMGVGPWAAIPLVLEKAGVTREAVDVWEINEAVAS